MLMLRRDGSQPPQLTQLYGPYNDNDHARLPTPPSPTMPMLGGQHATT